VFIYKDFDYFNNRKIGEAQKNISKLFFYKKYNYVTSRVTDEGVFLMNPLDPKHSMFPPLSSTSEKRSSFNVSYPGADQLSPSYIEEVIQNLEKDQGSIEQYFFEDKIRSVNITIAGLETHYGGKVALFLNFTLQNGKELKLVYKPRSVKADQIVEESIPLLYPQYQSRKILDVNDHGYDTFVKGAPPKGFLNFDQQNDSPDVYLDDIISDTQPWALMATLHQLGIEDLHENNFIYDKETKTLYCVDAECYQTGVSIVLTEFAQTWNLISEEEAVSSVLKQKKEKLRQYPSRLVFSSTERYNRYFKNHFWPEEVLFLGKDHSKYKYSPPEDVDFFVYQQVLFLKFLHTNQFFEWGDHNEFLSDKDISDKILNLIGEKGCEALKKEVLAAKQFSEGSAGIEIPIFHFDFSNTVTCGLTGEKIYINWNPF